MKAYIDKDSIAIFNPHSKQFDLKYNDLEKLSLNIFHKYNELSELFEDARTYFYMLKTKRDARTQFKETEAQMLIVWLHVMTLINDLDKLHETLFKSNKEHNNHYIKIIWLKIIRKYPINFKSLQGIGFTIKQLKQIVLKTHIGLLHYEFKRLFLGKSKIDIDIKSKKFK